VFNDAGADVDFRVEGDTNANLLFVDAGNDRVGIGTSSPTERLTVSGVASFGGSTNNVGISGSTAGLAGIMGTTADQVLNIYGNGTGAVAFRTGGAWLNGIDNLGTERMRITSAGDVGIGTSSPSAGLHVNKASGEASIKITSVDTAGVQQSLYFGATSFNRAAIKSLNANTFDGNLQFFTGNSSTFDERARIDSSGNLLVGTTTVVGKANIVQASQQSSGYTLFLQHTWTGDVGVAGLYIAKRDNNSTTSQILVRFSINNDAAGQGQINGNGASQAAFGTFSDRRLKENIVDLEPQLANICALRPVEFDYIESEGGGHQISFIAQEFEEVYPDAIGERSDGMKTLTGWGKTEARLVKAIKELKAELDTVKAELATLKGN
jgi:hypothetical protein